MRVIDGDTFVHANESIRVYNIDAPELDTDAGRRAKLAASELLADGYTLQRVGEDKYGRTLACVHTNSGDLGELLIDMGHARPWYGAEC